MSLVSCELNTSENILSSSLSDCDNKNNSNALIAFRLVKFYKHLCSSAGSIESEREGFTELSHRRHPVRLEKLVFRQVGRDVRYLEGVRYLLELRANEANMHTRSSLASAKITC